MAPPRIGPTLRCVVCEMRFYASPAAAKRGRKYCSMACRNRGYGGDDSLGRFWSYVAKSDGCWEWAGNVGKNGYGRHCVLGRRVTSHRWIWQALNGPIPNGMEICHHCDNKRCVRPDHLFLGTHRENMLDAWHKGRIPKPPNRYQEAHQP